MARIYSRIVNGVADILSARSRAVSKVRGMSADIKRGHLLHKQGVGNHYDSALKKARIGKTKK